MKCVWTPRRSGGKYILAALAVGAFATSGKAQDRPIPLPFPPAAPRTGPELPRVVAPSIAKEHGARTLDLETIEQLARANNPTLMQADAELEGELGKAVQAGLWYKPNLIYSGEQINVKAEGEGGSRHTPGEFQGLLLQQRFVTAGKLRLSREKYPARADAAKQQVRAQSLRVLNDVHIHYYRVLARAAQDGRGLDDENAGLPVLPDRAEPDPQQSIRGRQLRTLHGALKDADLMAQSENLQLKRRTATERGGK